MLFLLAVVLALLSKANFHTVTAPEYPDLYEASIAELQLGLEKKQFTSVDLVKVSLLVFSLSIFDLSILGIPRAHRRGQPQRPKTSRGD